MGEKGARAVGLRGNTAFLAAAAVLLPIAVFAALQIAGALAAERREMERAAIDLAADVIAQADAALVADISALEVLSGSPSLRLSEFERFRPFVERVAAARGWKGVTLAFANGQSILRVGEGQPAPISPATGRDASASPAIGDVVKVSDGAVVPLTATVMLNDATRLILQAELDPATFQTMLMAAQKGRPGVSAIVDRSANFVARSQDEEARVATPATIYVREAVSAGGKALYRGVTYEGLENYTAYATSSLSGWSAHFAVPAQTFNGLIAGAWGLTIIAAAFSAALGVGATVYLLRGLAARAAEDKRRLHSQKLEIIGQLAGGVIHDFNNFLSVMQAALRRIERVVPPGRNEDIVHARAAADKAAALVAQLMSFARSKPLELGPVDLCAAIREMEPLLKQSVGKNIDLTCVTDSAGAIARANASQFEIALLNIVINSRDAIDGKGNVEIRVRRVSDKELAVEIMDDGVGMTPDVARRAVEPFFTTKPEGKGTGLGLAQVHAFMNQCGGAMEIRSRPGKGALVVLTFSKFE